jgi:hypothetical protein
MGLPLILVVITVPLYPTWLVKQQNEGVLTYGMAFVSIFGVWLIPFLFDLIVLDILMFSWWTPKFVILPGMEEMSGYKNYNSHLKAHAKGSASLIVF